MCVNASARDRAIGAERRRRMKQGFGMSKTPVQRDNRALIGAMLFSLVIIARFYGAIA